MGILESLVIAIALSMDAFAVAVCKGLSIKNINYKHAIVIGCFFGGFQALMPFIGYTLGIQFEHYITAIDHWIAFALLSLIGINMIRESRECDCDNSDPSFNLKNITVLAFATSVDALAVGVTFAFLRVDVIPVIFIIGIITFICSFIGVRLGNMFGVLFKSKAEFAGGLILIIMGTKILLEHLGIINF